jgi:hypothetical protein
MMTSMTFQAASPFFMRPPRGARWAAVAFLRLIEALDLSRVSATARRHSRVEEAESVRAMARSLEATEPGFAADLYAAANRHEALGE